MKKNYTVTLEVILCITAVALLIYVLRSLLIFGASTFPHDHLYWGYPVFQFYAENIINGHIPLWNPFTHGGEPFYPLLVIQKLIDPIPLLTVYAGQFFTNDIVMLYNWNHFIQCLIMVSGIYIVFRPLADHWFIRLSLMPVLLFSSIIFSSFHQAAGLYHFIWLPYVTHFLLRIVYHKDYRWHNWLFLAALVGLNWQSYFFAGTWIFLLFFLVAVLFFRRDLLIDLLKNKKITPRIIVAIAIMCIMTLPNMIILLEKNRYVYPARIIESNAGSTSPMGGPQQFEGNSIPGEQGIVMPYKLIASTGTFSSIWDFIQIISPEGNKWIQAPDTTNTWGNASETYIYLGLLPWAIALLGIFLGKHELKKIWLFILISFGLLILGPSGGLHRLLYYLYPPLWFVRHTHGLSIIFLFSFLFFYILGLNYIYSTWIDPYSLVKINKENMSNILMDKKFRTENSYRTIAFLIFCGCIVCFVFLMKELKYPESNYLFLLLICCFIIGWLLRKYLKPEGIWAGLITSHIFLVFIFSTEPLIFMTKAILLIGIPLIAFLHIRRSNQIAHNKYLTSLLFILFAASLTTDFTTHIKLVSFLFKGQPHPKIAYNLDTTVTRPEPAHNRGVAHKPLYGYGTDPQSLRYISLLSRRPYVFSPVMTDDTTNLNFTEITTDLLNNNSFEEWAVSPDHILIPKDFFYLQDGTGGSCSRYEQKNGIRKGRYSALLSPSSHGNSMLRYHVTELAEFKGRLIKASVWVKSTNTTDDAVQFDLQDGLSAVKVKSYLNSGDWENLEITTMINEHSKALLFTLNVKHSANSEALFDDIKVDFGEKINEFTATLNSKRWNSFLMLKDYFKLIYLNLPPPAVEEMFAVGKPALQFKTGVIPLEDNDIVPLLKKLGPDGSVQLLDEYILVNNIGADSSLPQFKISFSEYEQMLKSRQLRNQHNNNFSYSINEYNHNSLSMDVSADKRGILYWSDGYDAKWHAYIDGKEVPVYRANINFKAIHLPEGLSQVRFVYKHPLFILSLFVFYGAFFLSITLALIVRLNNEQ